MSGRRPTNVAADYTKNQAHTVICGKNTLLHIVQRTPRTKSPDFCVSFSQSTFPSHSASRLRCAREWHSARNFIIVDYVACHPLTTQPPTRNPFLALIHRKKEHTQNTWCQTPFEKVRAVARSPWSYVVYPQTISFFHLPFGCASYKCRPDHPPQFLSLSSSFL